MTFAEKIKKLRTKLALTQPKFAKLLRTSQSAISCWENGKAVCAPEIIDRLKSICIKKGIRINWRG